MPTGGAALPVLFTHHRACNDGKRRAMIRPFFPRWHLRATRVKRSQGRDSSVSRNRRHPYQTLKVIDNLSLVEMKTAREGVKVIAPGLSETFSRRLERDGTAAREGNPGTRLQHVSRLRGCLECPLILRFSFVYLPRTTACFSVNYLKKIYKNRHSL